MGKVLWPKLQSGVLWTLVSNDFGVKRAHTARTPQLLADLGQIKAEILPNTRERLLEPVEDASWVGFVLIFELFDCSGGARQAQLINRREVFFIRLLSATLTQDWRCGQRRTTACRPAPSFYSFCHKASLQAKSNWTDVQEESVWN